MRMRAYDLICDWLQHYNKFTNIEIKTPLVRFVVDRGVTRERHLPRRRLRKSRFATLQVSLFQAKSIFYFCFQVLSMALPPDPHRGYAPGPRWGTSVPQTH